MKYSEYNHAAAYSIKDKSAVDFSIPRTTHTHKMFAIQKNQIDIGIQGSHY